MAVEVVSVHFPKAGGSSLRESLVAAYGNGAVYFDYLDDPANPCSSYSLDPEGCRLKAAQATWLPDLKVVHGHFHPSKYDFVRSAKRITFLRHPVDNVISIYYFWKMCDNGHSLFNYVREQQLTLLNVARLPIIRYLLSRTYFGGIDMSRFDFIGFMDSYAKDLRHLSQLLSIPVVESKVNINAYPRYKDEVGMIRSDSRLMSALRDCLVEDISFYERVKTRRTCQCAA